MRYISYIICIIISFFCWITNSTPHKNQEDSILKTTLVQSLKRLKRFLFSVDRSLTNALPGLKESNNTVNEDLNNNYEEYTNIAPMRGGKLKRVNPTKKRKNSLVPLPVQRKNPLGQKPKPKKILQKLNAVAPAGPNLFSLPVKSNSGPVTNKKPIASGPPSRKK